MKLERLLACTISVGMAALPVLEVPRALAAEPYNSEEQVRIDLYQRASSAVVTLEVGRSSGSGSIIEANGLVLTNEHVIRGARGGRVDAIASNGKRYPGRVIAVDRTNDLALVQLQASERLPVLSLASGSSIRVGQEVYAIGSPFGLSGTLTTGILSRIAENGDLQTDAAINPGNSGGPLLNSRGELIGVNKAILSPGGRGNIGIGFATSADAVKQFVASSRDAIASGGQTPSAPTAERPRLGVEVGDNLVIQSIERNSLAQRMGLRPGDRIVAINRYPLRSVDELVDFIAQEPEGMLLTVARGRRLATLQVRF